MSITLTINNTPFEYPEEGDQAPWGEAATGWATEVTKTLNSLAGPSDILETSAIINNNVTTYTDIAGFFFDPASVRSFTVQISVYRVYGSSEVSEAIQLVGLYQGAAGWLLQQDGIGNSGITLDITTAGQVQYKSSNLVGTPYSGIIKFRGIGVLRS